MQDIVLPDLHPAQQEIIDSPARFKVLACGRRFGKTTIAIDAICNRLFNGESAAYFAPTFRMGYEVWREIYALTYPLIRYAREDVWRLELLTGGVFEGWSLANSAAETVRGRKYHYVVVDEAALFDSPEVWHGAIRPLLTDYEGGALFCSTPKGRNWFWHLFLQGQSSDYADWQSWRFPTAVNPHINPNEIDAAKQIMPERFFRQEYLAEFLDDGGVVFRNIEKVCVGETFMYHSLPLSHASEEARDDGWRMAREREILRLMQSDDEVDRLEVAEYYTPGWRRRMGMPLDEKLLSAKENVSPDSSLDQGNLTPQPSLHFVERGSREKDEATDRMYPIPTGRGESDSTYHGEQVCFGVDWGKDNDFTCVSVMTRSGRQIHLERFNQIGWAVQRGRLVTLYERFKPYVILAEENSIGSVNIEALRAEGLPVRGFNTTRKSKAPLIEALALAMEKEEVVLLNHETLKHELMAYEMKRTSYGWSYSAPSGGHDDTVMATALSLWATRWLHPLRIDWI